MKYPAHRSLPVLAILVLTPFALTHCGKSLSTAKTKTAISLDNKEAQARIDDRLRKTEETRIKMENLRRALRPIESFIRDISKSLELSIDGKSPTDLAKTESLQHVLRRLQITLKEASSGMVKHNPDGSWILDKKFIMKDEDGKVLCQESHVILHGERIASKDQLNLDLSECQTGEMANLFTASFVSEKELSLKLNAKAFENAVPDSRYNATPNKPQPVCELFKGKNTAEFYCDPITIRLDRKRQVLFEGIRILEDSRGFTAYLHALLTTLKGDFVAEAELSAEPGKTPSVNICSKQESCQIQELKPRQPYSLAIPKE